MVPKPSIDFPSNSLVLIDAMALIHRSFHAIPILSQGERPVNAVYGFASTLIHVINTIQPTYMAVAFDEKGPTFRHTDYKDYKATRVAPVDALKVQFSIARQMVETFGIQIFGVPGYEADDLIGTLSVQATQKGVTSVIVTGDQDTYQLINDKVVVYNVSRGAKNAELIDEQAILTRYGFSPSGIVTYKALKGDASDNIPGVKGIGEKMAKNLVAEFGTIEKLYEDLDCNEPEKVASISAKIKDLLCAQEDSARMSGRLATIALDAPIELDLSSCRLTDYNETAVRAFFEKYNFKSLLSRLPKYLDGDSQKSLF